MRLLTNAITRHPFACALAALALVTFAPLLSAEPVKTHPRLLFRADEVQALRNRMTESNDVWMAFKSEVVDKCLRDWKCSATSHKAGAPNYNWVRDTFTDEFGVTHFPADSDWGTYSSQTERPAVPEDDDGNGSGNTRVSTEQHAMLFALMARLLKDTPGQEIQAQRLEYLAAARECLFHIIDHAKDGHPAPDAEGHYPPFQHIGFATDDRSFSAESFALAVDWIYEDLTADELAKVRKTFLIWADDCNKHTYFAPGYPHGTPNSPSLLRLNDPYEQQTRGEIRLALNNHWANHLRESVLFALALDPKDDIPSAAFSDTAPAGALTSHTTPAGSPDVWIPQQSGVLHDFLGVWQYLTDYSLRNDGAGGLSLEGTQYASNGLGPIALMLAALQSAGQDNPQQWGPQISLDRHPFWNLTVPSYLAQLTPTPRVPTGPGLGYLGPIYQPPISGDLETFAAINDQFIKVLGPIALADARTNGTNGAVVQAVRYIQRNLAPGGPSALFGRMASKRSNLALRDAIYYFLLFDPLAPVPVDPRLTLQPKTFFAQHTVNGKLMGMVLARSGDSAADTYFHWRNDWNHIDHQVGDSLGFGLWKNSLWLTKPMTGYGNVQSCSDYRNSLSLQNGVPSSSPLGESTLANHGSQWNRSQVGDPEIVARSTGDAFLQFTGDATNLYNHRSQPQLREIEHASRSIVWLKPDRVVIYDRARSKQAGFFKRFFLNVPRDPVITGNVARSSAMEGAVEKARLFVTSLLPAGATIQSKTIDDGEPAGGIDSVTGRPSFEDMWAQIFVEAPGAPQDARFLHVLQGTDAGVATPDSSQLVTSSGGAFEGAVVGTRCVMFRKTLGIGSDSVSYTHTAGVTEHYITGLPPFAGFDVFQTATSASIVPGTQRFTDGGGVLVLGGAEPPSVEIVAADATGSETGDALSFTLKRSGDVSVGLNVNVVIDSSLSVAVTADLISFPFAVSFAAGSATAALTLTPFDDTDFEGSEELVVRVATGSGYHSSEAADKATATITENDAPPGGTLQFASATFTAVENSGNAIISVSRAGGSAGTVSVRVTTSNGTSTAPAEYTTTSEVVTWPVGDTTAKVILVPLINNSTYTGDRTINLNLTQLTGQSGFGTPTSAVLTITDDDPPPPGNFTLTPLTVTTVENGPALTFTITRTGGTGGAVSVQYATVNGSATGGADFQTKTGTLTWPASDGLAKPVTVPLLDDTVFEGNEAFSFVISNPTGGAIINGSATATITLTENDPQPSEFHVGPGQSYTSLTQVPWQIVGAGSDVFIHYDPAGYHAKMLLSNRGTEAQPIRIIGIPGPDGERPILDGQNALPPTAVSYINGSSTEDQALIAIERDNTKTADFKPGWIEIHGLELRNAHPDYNYSRQSGATDDWSSLTGAIYIGGADHVRIRDCVIHHCANGIVTANGGSSEAGTPRTILIDRCHFYSNGKAGAYYGYNLNCQAIGLTLQFSRLDPSLAGANVPNVLDRSAGFIARYNWIEGGGSQIDMAEPSATVPLLTGDPSWPVTQVSGNILRNFDSSSGNVIHFGGSEKAGLRTLHFHHNTVHCTGGYKRNVLNVRAADETAIAHANVLRQSGITEFRLLAGAGTAQFGKNLASPGFFTPPPGATGTANIITAATPGFANEASGDYHPAAGSPLLDAAQPLPSGALPITAQYAASAAGDLRADGTLDLGALEATRPADLADSDSNGIVNLLEAGLTLDTLTRGSLTKPALTIKDGHLVLTVEKAPTAGGINLAVETSTTLLDWNANAITTLVNTPTFLRARLDTPEAGSPQQFMRLRLTRP